MSSPKVIEVVAAVIVEDGKVFATQRGPGKDLAGYWEFPGGKMEAGESAAQALAREISEELACAIRIGKRITTTEHITNSAILQLHTFWCELADERPSLQEHSDAQWVAPHALQKLRWAPADIPTVQRLREICLGQQDRHVSESQ